MGGGIWSRGSLLPEQGTAAASTETRVDIPALSNRLSKNDLKLFSVISPNKGIFNTFFYKFTVFFWMTICIAMYFCGSVFSQCFHRNIGNNNAFMLASFNNKHVS